MKKNPSRYTEWVRGERELERGLTATVCNVSFTRHATISPLSSQAVRTITWLREERSRRERLEKE